MGQEIHKAYADSSLGQIHYRIAGQGKPLLLVHQDPQSALQFLYVMPLLIDAGFQVIAPDMPGYGLSEGSSEPSTIPEYADVLVQLLDHLEIDQAIVVGHHTGASMACQMAYANPKRVERLVLHGLPWYTTDEREERLARPHMDFSAKKDGSHFSDLWILIEKMSRGISTLESSHMAALHTLWAGDKHWFAHHAAFSYDMTDAISGVSAPTLVVTNTGDILHFVAARLVECRPDFSLVELEGGTSYIIRDDPEGWFSAIIDFIKS